MATVYERVKTIVVDKLGVESGDVEESSSFVEDLNADSLDLVEMIMAFEEEFSTDDQPIEISDEDAGQGTSFTILSNRDGIPVPSFADTYIISSSEKPSVWTSS